jgi:hypothetical protein
MSNISDCGGICSLAGRLDRRRHIDNWNAITRAIVARAVAIEIIDRRWWKFD